MTRNEDFDESEETFNLIRLKMIDELEMGEVSSDLCSRFEEAANEFMNCGLELTREELISAKLLAHETGHIGAEIAILDSAESIDRIKLLEYVLDDLRTEDLVLAELSGDLRAQISEVAELENQVEEATQLQSELSKELESIKKSRHDMNMILVECEHVEQLESANSVLRQKLESQKRIVEAEIQLQQQTRDEKSRLHDHWIMEKRNKELQLESLNDELYIAVQTRRKHESGQHELVQLIATCENELREVKSIVLDIPKSPSKFEENTNEFDKIVSAIAELEVLIEANREARVRRAIAT
jgi:hypothetical protein